MGMAASQARFLQLTARKTNLEYQGQQINQERLALANQSAGLFERQLNLDPPTPPSSLDDQYYTPGYTFTCPETGVQKRIIMNYAGSGDFTTAAISYDQYLPDGSSQTQFETYDGDLDNSTSGGNIVGEAAASAVTINGQSYTSTVDASALSLGNVTYDASTGRITGFEYGVTGTETTFAGDDITYSPEFDEDSFNDAMNQYEYQKATYDYEVERINLETAQIQEQDRSLELKMKQIDTEHKAISTEIDAVQKVIQKSIESSFKTFS